MALAVPYEARSGSLGNGQYIYSKGIASATPAALHVSDSLADEAVSSKAWADEAVGSEAWAESTIEQVDEYKSQE